jgi:hypothetical protein
MSFISYYLMLNICHVLCFRSTVSEVVLWLLYYIISQLLEKNSKKATHFFQLAYVGFGVKFLDGQVPWTSTYLNSVLSVYIILYMLMVKTFFSAF